MAVKVIIFDLDGVLVDTVELHFKAFTQALAEVGCIMSWEEHHERFNGLPTRVKIQMLIDEERLPPDMAQKIADRKAQLTDRLIDKTMGIREDIRAHLRDLALRGLVMNVASNAKEAAVEKMLQATGICGFFMEIWGNERVANPKPAPDIFLKMMEAIGVKPSEVLIIEDSPKGLEAAFATGARVLPVKDSHSWDAELVIRCLGDST